MSDIRTVEFNSLPEGVRERFVAITTGTAGPAPLLAEKTSTKSKIIGLSFLCVLLAVGAFVAVMIGMGDLYNDFSIHGPLLVLLAYIPAGFALFFLLLPGRDYRLGAAIFSAYLAISVSWNAIRGLTILRREEAAS